MLNSSVNLVVLALCRIGPSSQTMPHRPRPVTTLLLFTGLNVVLVSTVSPAYDYVCFHPYWERRVCISCCEPSLYEVEIKPKQCRPDIARISPGWGLGCLGFKCLTTRLFPWNSRFDRIRCFCYFSYHIFSICSHCSCWMACAWQRTWQHLQLEAEVSVWKSALST